MSHPAPHTKHPLPRKRTFFGLLTLAPLLFITSASSAKRPTPTTPNTFYMRGAPTYVLGTSGDAKSDRGIASQVSLMKGLLFPKAKVLLDTSIDATKGPKAWPSNPILYGGPHVHRLLSSLSPTLPFQMKRGLLKIGGQSFRGPSIRLISVIPARKKDAQGPGYPSFLLYAGTGVPGVAEINSVRHGTSPILIADGFGPLAVGRWERSTKGTFVAKLANWRGRRISWRVITKTFKTHPLKKPATARFLFPRQLPPSKKEALLIKAGLRGLQSALLRLQITSTIPVSLYIYPDARSKKSLSGRWGHGHAVISSKSLHVLPFEPSPGGGFERLIAHEGTHLYAYEAWGPPATPLFGEGLAVWVSGQYGGHTLSWWRKRTSLPYPITQLLGRLFSLLPERNTYPFAGLLVEAIIKQKGLQVFRQHFYPATQKTWSTACKKTGLNVTHLKPTPPPKR